jgi:hypothetical protein
MSRNSVRSIDNIILLVGAFRVTAGILSFKATPIIDSSSTTRGSNKSTSSVVSNDMDMMVELTLLDGVDENTNVNIMLMAQVGLAQGFPFVYQDPSKTNEYIRAPKCLIKRRPDIMIEKDQTSTYTWTFETLGADVSYSGSTSII